MISLRSVFKISYAITLLFLLPEFVSANTFSPDMVWGRWESQQASSCLRGGLPKVRPDVVLFIEPKLNKDNSAIRISVNKQVKSFSCVVPNLVKDELFLSVFYTFDVIPVHHDFLAKRTLMKKLTQAGITMEDFQFTLNGVGKAPDSYELNKMTMFLCNPFAIIDSPISFPDYFTTELTRQYLVYFEEGRMDLFFEEEMICPEDVTIMSFRKR
ncbi:MAG: hypothetical protein H6625_08540 [Bdellovibrionaceae bacterium]|nr:hypothetical protein [Pseudobdellovibrionaceae bacterium]